MENKREKINLAQKWLNIYSLVLFISWSIYEGVGGNYAFCIGILVSLVCRHWWAVSGSVDEVV